MNEPCENEESSEPDQPTKNRVELAWKCIREQYFEHSKKTAMEEGPGMSIFKFLRAPKDDGSNCQYFYTEKDGPMWRDIINFSSDGEKLQEIYDPVTTVAICVHIPMGSYGDRTIGNLKFFHRDSEEEITIISLPDLPPDNNEGHKDKPSSQGDNCGLRKRKVSSAD